MSSARNQSASSVREKAWLPKALDVETYTLNAMTEVFDVIKMVNDVGDMTKTNSAIEAVVLYLEEFVKNWLDGNSDPDFQDYLKGRDEIVKDWKETGQHTPETVRKLYGYCVKALAQRRLFKTRRTAYFVYHWKVGMEAKKTQAPPDLEELERDLEETEGEGQPEAEEMVTNE